MKWKEKKKKERKRKERKEEKKKENKPESNVNCLEGVVSSFNKEVELFLEIGVESVSEFVCGFESIVFPFFLGFWEVSLWESTFFGLPLFLVGFSVVEGGLGFVEGELTTWVWGFKFNGVIVVVVVVVDGGDEVEVEVEVDVDILELIEFETFCWEVGDGDVFLERGWTFCVL